MLLSGFPRVSLAHLPTRLEFLPRLTEQLGGPEIWVKRDDCTGLATGGNKTRKLEYVIGDALQQEADTLVTVGAVQSNHCRQTAAGAAQNGLRCILLLAGAEPEEYTGNLLLDRLFGAEIQFFPDDDFDQVSERMESVVETLRDLGLKPYGIPAGAFMPVGCIAYVQAMLELKEQCDEIGMEPKKILHPVGTGGTLAGMIIGAKLAEFDADVIGISVLRDAKTTKEKGGEMIDRMFDAYPALIDKFKPDILLCSHVHEAEGIEEKVGKTKVINVGKKGKNQKMNANSSIPPPSSSLPRSPKELPSSSGPGSFCIVAAEGERE